MPSRQSPENADETDNSEADAFQDRTMHTVGGSSAGQEFGPGAIIGDAYEILSFIGAGGMGNVYRVRHTILRTEYALKTLSSDKVTEVAWRRFQVEAQAIARMNHPNIVGIYNLGLHQGQLPFYVMDILSGSTLAQLLEQKKYLEVDEALKIFVEVCVGIGYAHKKGIVHRDIKPGNIVVLDKADASGARVKIVDFGIAKLSHTKDLANQQLTGMGEVCGSPFYMSPEQCQAGKIDARSDTYSLGCTLFETLTGTTPFKGRNAMETMFFHSNNQPPTLKAACGRSFPAELEAALAKAMAKAPMDRYQTTENLAQDLETILRAKTSPQNEKEANKQTAKYPFVAMTVTVLALLAISAVAFIYFGPNHSATSSGTVNKAPIVIKDYGQHHFTDNYTDVDKSTGTGTGKGTGAGTDTGTATSTDTRTDTATGTGTGPNPEDKTPWATIDLPAVVNKSYIHFTFPEKQSLGMMISFATKKRLLCQGKLPPLPYGTCVFSPDAAFIEHPQYFERFGPVDLYALDFDTTGTSAGSEDKFDLNTFKHCLHLKGLMALTFIECPKLDDTVMDYVEQFPLLSKFTCMDSNVSAKRLSQSTILKRLDQLTISTEDSLTPLLRALKGSSTLQILDVTGAQLSREDINLIATMTHLIWLRCKDAALTDADLEVLSKLPNLLKLECSRRKITRAANPKMIKIMAQGGGKSTPDSVNHRDKAKQELKVLFSPSRSY